MMIVVIDASIIIDLLQVELFGAFLRLGWEGHVSFNVTNEIQEENSDELIKAIEAEKLFLPQFSPEDLAKIQKLKSQYSPLSLADCSCMYLAKELPAILLTGERKLNSIASNNYGIEVHGTLWIMEKMIEGKIIDNSMAHRKLTELMTINNRLPKGECMRLLKRWTLRL